MAADMRPGLCQTRPPGRNRLGRGEVDAVTDVPESRSTIADPARPARPLVSVIAINYNGAALLHEWVGGVRASDYPNLEILVVDNASTDDTAAQVATLPDVRLVASAENLGFGGGCNLGARESTGELLLFMNPDVRLDPEAISVLVDDLLRTPDAAITCATMLEPGVEHVRADRVEDVAAMAAATLLTSRRHFEALKGFDTWMFLYGEDTDICFRTWLLGGRVLKSWNAVAGHALGGTGGGVKWSGQQIRNGLYVHLKTRSWPSVLRFAALQVAKTVVRGVQLRDPAVLTAWSDNVRELPATLAKRRAIRGPATADDRARLERLGAEHAYWARRGFQQRTREVLAQRLGR